MASDINAILKKYLDSKGKSEAGVAELTNNLRGWVVENSEVVKEKIEKQIDEAAIRRGFVKASDLDSLLVRISDLESRISTSENKDAKVSKSKSQSKDRVQKKNGKRLVKKKSAASKKDGK